MTKKVLTKFAPAERSTRAEINKQYQYLNSILGTQSLVIKKMPYIHLILNKNRQIVFANHAALTLANKTNIRSILGLRPGELLDCDHASENKAGCGTTIFCTQCGVVRAILSGLEGNGDIQECRITKKKTGEALDLRVWTYPLQYGEETFTSFVVADISNEKRRRMLERIFFHDIMNTATGLLSFSEILKLATPEELQKYGVKDTITILVERLIDEINAQKQFLAAENNELVVKPEQVDSLNVLHGIAALYRSHNVSKGKNIVIDTGAKSYVFETDKTLLSRVIGNMVKNALEASDTGQTVTMGCDNSGPEIQFWVKNPAFIPTDVQLQIFQRSFSTRGAGRGIGTYSIKLLTEKYLNGKVSFTSSEKDGTTFTVKYPESLVSSQK